MLIKLQLDFFDVSNWIHIEADLSALGDCRSLCCNRKVFFALGTVYALQHSGHNTVANFLVKEGAAHLLLQSEGWQALRKEKLCFYSGSIAIVKFQRGTLYAGKYYLTLHV